MDAQRTIQADVRRLQDTSDVKKRVACCERAAVYSAVLGAMSLHDVYFRH